MRSIWDDLYDLYCHVEERCISHLSSGEDINISFPERACDLVELKKIRDFLGPKCEDYLRFLEFYNGMTLGQWFFFSTDDPDGGIVQLYHIEIALRENTPSNIEGKMLPMAIDKARPYSNGYYISKSGAIFSLPSESSKQEKPNFDQEPILISPSFEEFMRECVLGTRYPEFGKEDATYRFVQRYLKDQAKLDEEELQKYGVCNDVDRNPTRDPRIITSLREMGRDMARQTYEQTKGLPAGTVVNFS
jgi:hypothetical protein